MAVMAGTYTCLVSRVSNGVRLQHQWMVKVDRYQSQFPLKYLLYSRTECDPDELTYSGDRICGLGQLRLNIKVYLRTRTNQ